MKPDGRNVEWNLKKVRVTKLRGSYNITGDRERKYGMKIEGLTLWMAAGKKNTMK